jgi:hypothetical protein
MLRCVSTIIFLQQTCSQTYFQSCFRTFGLMRQKNVNKSRKQPIRLFWQVYFLYVITNGPLNLREIRNIIWKIRNFLDHYQELQLYKCTWLRQVITFCRIEQ